MDGNVVVNIAVESGTRRVGLRNDVLFGNAQLDKSDESSPVPANVEDERVANTLNSRVISDGRQITY
jgi:hypothetical protein